MQLASDPAELTSAATDLVLAGIAATGIWLARGWLWRLTFGGLALVAVAGVAVHGLTFAPTTTRGLWLVLQLLLGLSVALFALAALRDGGGPTLVRRAAVPLIAAGLTVGVLAQYYPETFLPFILFNGIVLIGVGALGVLRRRWRLAGGCLIALLAGAVQATSWRLDLIWEFDHNGLFHLVQIPAHVLWIRAARTQAPA